MADNNNINDMSSPFSKDLISSLDLIPIIQKVASQTATQRGRQALLDLVQLKDLTTKRRRGRGGGGQGMDKYSFNGQSTPSSSRQRRVAQTMGGASSLNDYIADDFTRHMKKQSLQLSVARNAKEAKRLYEEVAQASQCLQQQQNSTTMIPLPPIYGYYDTNNNKQASTDTTTTTEKSSGNSKRHSSSSPPFFDPEGRGLLDVDVVEDYDDWLELPLDEWTLEHIVQAEQVIQMLLRVHAWATLESIMSLAPLLSQVIIDDHDDDDDTRRGHDDDDNVVATTGAAAVENNSNDSSTKVDYYDILKPLLDEIAGAVEILRVKTLTDPMGRSSYMFRLNGKKYKVLQLLREKKQEQAMTTASSTNVQNKDKKNNKNNIQKQQQAEQDDLDQELEEREQAIQRGLSLAIFKCRKVIDDALIRVAQLDVIFAKAAFGLLYPAAVIPEIQQSSSSATSSSVIHVPQFLHPLLPRNEAVPIELRLGSTKSQKVDAISVPRALILSGSNGGGKTLTMKSFGVVSILVKLGIPLPTTRPENNINNVNPSVSVISSSATTDMSRPRVDFFNNVIAVVGDRQNVMKGQSTFMAQLATYSGIIQQVATSGNRNAEISKSNNDANDNATKATATTNQTTLVLLDELGSGTEANAGGAIAQSILEKLLECPSCHVVATTHSLRLKTLSFENENYDCAAATVHRQQHQQPTSLSSPHDAQKQAEDDSTTATSPTTTRFQLQYGVIGESYALDAASRCTTPPLPEDVLSRAASLMASSTISNLDTTTRTAEDLDYVRALKSSLERQLEMAQEARFMAESIAKDTARCQSAMLTLAWAYDRHLGFLEHRVESCFQQLRDDLQEKENESSSSYKILGDSLSEIHLVRKQVKSEAQLLQERGLRRIPIDYQLTKGESVVIIDDGEWDGITAKVVLVADKMSSSATVLPFGKKTQIENSDTPPESPLERPLLPDEVAVEISPFEMIMPPNEWNDAEFSLPSGIVGKDRGEETSRLLIFKRRDVAMWDYSSSADVSTTITSIPDSKRRLSNILSTLRSTSEVGESRRRPSFTGTSSMNINKSSGISTQQQYRSSRERKAAAKDKESNKKKRKKQ